LDDFLECEVHVCVAADQMSVQGFAILEFDEHRVALSGSEESEGELDGEICSLVA
jgi:hypothetical protein